MSQALTPEILSSSDANMVAIQPPMTIDPAAVAAAEEAKALVQAAYTMALHRPRNYMQARQRILDACKRPAFAAAVEYAKPVGGSTVRGPSIRFAELAIQQWGNIRVDTTTTFENDEFRKIRVQVLDLETNSCFGKVITVYKTVERRNGTGREIIRSRANTSGQTVFIVRATEEELAVKEAAAISKVVRNEGLRLIPQDIIDEALEAAKAARRGDVSDPQERIRKVCDLFSAMRVTPEDLTLYLRCPIDKASPAQIDDLQTVYTAIRSGEAKWSDYVQYEDASPESGTANTAEKLKGKLSGVKAAGGKVTNGPTSTVENGPPPASQELTISCPRKDGASVPEEDCFYCPERENCPARMPAAQS